MDGKVIKPFFDLKNPDDVYVIGDTFSGTAERVTELVNKGFLEPMAEKPKRQSRRKSTTRERD